VTYSTSLKEVPPFPFSLFPFLSHDLFFFLSDIMKIQILIKISLLYGAKIIMLHNVSYLQLSIKRVQFFKYTNNASGNIKSLSKHKNICGKLMLGDIT
jgi:hypothetical protein